MTVSVVLADSTRAFDKEYTYRIPENMQLIPGMRVLIPFGKGNTLRDGWVIEMNQNPPKVKYVIKEVSSQIDDEPIITEELLKLARWMRSRYLCTWHQALSCMLPSGARLVMKADGSYRNRASDKTRAVLEAAISPETFESMNHEGSFRSLHHINVLETLFDDGPCSIDDLCLLQGVTPAILRTMVKKGWLIEYRQEVERDPFSTLNVQAVSAPEPTEEQESAYSQLLPLLDKNPGSGEDSEALVFGVTGSGKTELYLRLIEATIDRGKGAIMLVPEISLTPQTVERFLGRFENHVAVLHSRLSIGERYDQWRRIRKGELDIIVGARSAVFAPLKNVGVIIIDEEHEGAYKAENMPRYDARLVARARCNISGGLLLYGSATPSLETFYRAECKQILRVNLTSRAAGRVLPEVQLVDMRQELAKGNHTHFSVLLEQEIKSVQAQGEQTILFLNRRGMSAFILCRDCGHVLLCPNCSVSLTVHQKNRCVCHHCGHLEAVPHICPSCKGENLLPLGIGTQKVEEELTHSITDYRVIRMDLDSTSGKEGHKKLLDLFRNGEADILVGTQMVAKGHDFPNVTLVGILSADMLLNSGDFRSSERTFQLLAQAAGRAGRAEKPGKVIIQAFNIDHYSLKAVIEHNYVRFYEQELSLRKLLSLPPFFHIGLILFNGLIHSSVELVSDKTYKFLKHTYGTQLNLIISEPMAAPIAVLNGKHRIRIIIRHEKTKALLEVMKTLQIYYDQEKFNKEVNIMMDIDPNSMM